jgi:hypothetical protein
MVRYLPPPAVLAAGALGAILLKQNWSKLREGLKAV